MGLSPRTMKVTVNCFAIIAEIIRMVYGVDIKFVFLRASYTVEYG